MSTPKYVAFDFEMPGEADDPSNFWHVFSTDQDEHDTLDGGSLFYIYGPDTPEMLEAVRRAVEAINDAVALAERLRRADPK